jgi:hypothetical protein
MGYSGSKAENYLPALFRSTILFAVSRCTEHFQPENLRDAIDLFEASRG